ncbi:MAG: helix-turn-helix domain-containing protein [Cryobacterium sp.]
MALRSDWSADNCPVARGLEVFGDPWSVLVLREVFLGNRRFDGLRATLGAAENILSARLRRLTEAGLLRKVPYGGGARPRQEYHLTPAGEDALPVLNAVAAWAQKHTVSPTGRAMTFWCTRCGQSSASADWCATCNAAITVADAAWERPTAPGVRIDLAAVLDDA